MSEHEATQSSATPVNDKDSVSSRRSLLRGALAGVGVAAAGAVLLPDRAEAASGDYVRLAYENTASNTTILDGVQLDPVLLVSTDGFNSLRVYNSLDHASAVALSCDATTVGTGIQSAGHTGVRGRGYTSDGIGVAGESAGTGVKGESDSSAGETYGVLGLAHSTQSRAVFGWNSVPGATGGGTGVFGQSNGTAGVGVRGLAYDGDAATGGYGTGVLGFAGYHDKASWPVARTNTGVFGTSPSGVGVVGASPAGTGVRAESATGTALKVQGTVSLSRSGRVVFAAGKQSATVAVPGGLSARSNASATAQGYVGGVLVAAAVPDPAHGTVTIYLSKAVPANHHLTVAWFVTEF